MKPAGMAPDVHIRRAEPADAATIEDVLLRSWRAVLRELVPDAVPSAAPRARWSSRLADAAATDRRFWVVSQGGTIAGIAGTAPTRDLDDEPRRTSELMLLYVQPESWGLGLGRALMAHSVDDVRRRGWRELTLWVFEGNARARHFYVCAGLQPDGGRKTVERSGARLGELRYRMSLG